VLSVESQPVSLDEQAPRLYIVKRDVTSGVELLRQSDVTNYLTDARGDPDSVVLTEILPNCPDVACITVLRRTTQSPSEMWLCPYTHETVVPPGLQISTTSMARRKVSRMTLVYRTRLAGITCGGQTKNRIKCEFSSRFNVL